MNKEQGFLAGAGIVASNHAERTGGRFHLQVALGVDPMEALEHPHLWSSSQLHFFIPSHGGAAHVTPPSPLGAAVHALAARARRSRGAPREMTESLQAQARAKGGWVGAGSLAG